MRSPPLRLILENVFTPRQMPAVATAFVPELIIAIDSGPVYFLKRCQVCGTPAASILVQGSAALSPFALGKPAQAAREHTGNPIT